MPTIEHLPLEDDDVFVDTFDTMKRRLPTLFVQRFDGVKGEAVMRGVARVFSELMRFVVSQTGSILLREATGPQRAVGTITIAFDDETAYDYGIAAGNPIAVTKWGLVFILEAPLYRYAGDGPGFSVTLPVSAEWAGDWYNIAPNMVREWAIADFNNVDSIEWASGTSDGHEEFLARVRQGRIGITESTRMNNGRLGTLDLVMAEKGLPREPGESDESGRNRARTAPLDAITPNGIVRAANKALGYQGARLVEYWQSGFAWGVSGWGLHPWSRKMYATLLIPQGEDVAAMQGLVDRIRLPGVYIKVREQAG